MPTDHSNRLHILLPVDLSISTDRSNRLHILLPVDLSISRDQSNRLHVLLPVDLSISTDRSNRLHVLLPVDLSISRDQSNRLHVLLPAEWSISTPTWLKYTEKYTYAANSCKRFTRSPYKNRSFHHQLKLCGTVCSPLDRSKRFTHHPLAHMFILSPTQLISHGNIDIEPFCNSLDVIVSVCTDFR